jgi:hypothetical protein
MDSIKKKMEKLASETAEAEARIAHFEELKVCLALKGHSHESVFYCQK